MELELLWEGPLWFPWSWRYVQPPKWSSNRLRNDPNFYSRRPRNHPQLILGMEELLAQKARTDKIEGPSLLPFMPRAVSKYNWTWEKNPIRKELNPFPQELIAVQGNQEKFRPCIHSWLVKVITEDANLKMAYLFWPHRKLNCYGGLCQW